MTATVTPMSCQAFVELVTDYLDSALDEATRERFEHHLGLCPGCETYVRQMQETAARLGDLSLDSLPADAQSMLLHAFRGFRR
jgi:anti-sigma factor RsiW